MPSTAPRSSISSIAFVGAFLGRAVIRMVAQVGETFLRDLRIRVFRHLLSLGLDFFEREKTGRLVARMTSDIEALQELVSIGLVMFVQNVLIFVGAIVAIFLLSWQLALFTLVVVPPVIIASRWFRRESNRAYLEVRDAIGQNLSTLQEGLAGVRVVQAFAREGAVTRRFRGTNEAQYDANLETVRISARYFPIVEFSGVAGTALIIGVGGWFVNERHRHGRHRRRVRPLPEQPVRAGAAAEPAVQPGAAVGRGAPEAVRAARHADVDRRDARAPSTCPRSDRSRSSTSPSGTATIRPSSTTSRSR